MTKSSKTSQRAPESDTKTIDRRGFLKHASGGLLSIGVFGGPMARLLTGCETHGEIPRVSGTLRTFITPTDGSIENTFYVRFGLATTTVNNHPQPTTSDWSLAITGEIGNPLTITYDDVIAKDAQEGQTFLKTMRCVFDAPSEPLIANAFWRGVPLRAFIEEAMPDATALRLNITGADGFRCNLTMDRVLNDTEQDIDASVPLLPVYLAHQMNGGPIPSVHGGPVRLIVVEKFGFKNMKWPTEVNLTSDETPSGYYEDTLFPGNPETDIGNIALTSVFTAPVEREPVVGPDIAFFGIAISGGGTVARVEIALDGGLFEPAEVISFEQVLNDPTLFFGEDGTAAAVEAVRQQLVQVTDPRFADGVPSIWQLWRHSARLTPGIHEAQVRATGTDGAVQPERDRSQGDGNSEVRTVTFEVF